MPQDNADIIWSLQQSQVEVGDINMITESSLSPEKTFAGLNDLALLNRVYEIAKSEGSGDTFIPFVDVVKQIVEQAECKVEDAEKWFNIGCNVDYSAKFNLISIESVRGKVGKQMAFLQDRLKYGQILALKEHIDEYKEITGVVSDMDDQSFRKEVRIAINKVPPNN